jgi:fructoselysine-6-P-deglycase FrlB-like protein
MSAMEPAGQAMGTQLSAAATARLRRLHPDGPDEMGRELAEGPEAVAATLRLLGEHARVLQASLGTAERLVLLGTGASLAMARAAAPSWRSLERAGSRPRAVLVRESTEAVFGGVDGDAFRSGDLVVAISQSGSSPETLAAARLAVDAGARVLAVTAHETSPLAGVGAARVVLPIDEERGAATKSELATLAALLGLAGGLTADPAEIAAARSWLSGLVDSWQAVLPAVTRLAAARRTWIVGLGPTAGLAHAGSLLWHEKVHRQTVGTTVSEFRHGLVEPVGPRDAALVIAPWPCSSGLAGYLELLVGELRQLGAAVVWLDTGTPGGLAPAGAEIVPLPAAPALDAIFGAVRLLGATLRLQQLARGTAHAGGSYVDGFRVLRRVVQAAPDRFG